MKVQNKSYHNGRNITRQVKEMDEIEEMSLSDKAIQRLREYLLNEGWTAEKILDLLDYITK